MSLGLNVLLRNARLDAVTAFVAGSALLRIYSGTQPATGGSIGAAVLLAQLTGNATFAAGASSGVLTLNSIAPANSAAATGTANWFRLVKADGTTFCFDGTVSTVSAGTGDLRLDNTAIVLGGTVAISSGTITEGNS